jgi:hypothetical protein
MSDQLSPSEDQTPHAHFAQRGRNRVPYVRSVFLLVFAVVIAAIAFTGEAFGHHRNGSSATISVTGSGTVTGTPNTMNFQIGVQSIAPSAAAALDANNVKMKALEASLLKNGVTKKNLQTSGFDIYQNTNNSGTVTGYTAEDDLNVTMHNLTKAGTAIDAAAHVVGNGIQLSGVTFSISNQSHYLAQARARAMKNALTEATQVAQGGHTTVGSIVRVTDQENTGSTGPVFPYAEVAAKAASGVPIQRGTQTVSVQVSVVYALAS